MFRDRAQGNSGFLFAVLESVQDDRRYSKTPALPFLVYAGPRYTAGYLGSYQYATVSERFVVESHDITGVLWF